MALQKQFNHPFKPGTYDGYIWIAETNFNHYSKTGKITFFVNESAEAADQYYPPIHTIELEITPNGKPAVYGPRPLIQAPVYDTIHHDEETDGQGNIMPAWDEQVEISGAIYGDPPVLVPRMPGFDEIIYSNLASVVALSTSIYQLSLTQPQFAGCTPI